MQKSPHMLIEGIAIAPWAAGIAEAFIYIRGEYALQADTLDRAVAEARQAGYIGENVLGSGHSLSLVVHRGAGAYICGEETGLLDSLEGKRGNPRLKPPFPAINGLYQGPTLINNVETLSTVPAIVDMGGKTTRRSAPRPPQARSWFRSQATSSAPATTRSNWAYPRASSIYGLAGGPPTGARSSAGSRRLLRPGADGRGSRHPLRLRFAGQGRLDARLGAIIVVDDSTPILDVALKVAKFYRHESCGKCTPCREGTNWTVKMLERIEDGEATPMDLDIMASVRTHIIGHCLCVLGDAMAMPIGSMIVKFRESSRRTSSRRACMPPSARWPAYAAPAAARSPSRSTAARCRRPRTRCSSTRPSTATSRSRSSATSPSSASPVGACRMCLVEIEGIPKLQTGCSTPVKDGMVVNTQSERVKEAQQTVVEFLLINHPLDCPVCDKGGECPLQDITFGWGGGISRFIEPKRHFVKPLALSPQIAIDRERCILCYRCVRFSQEVSEDDQLVLLERGAHSYVATFDGHPYVAPFSGNIVELCPVGALTSPPYRFQARPVGHRGRRLGLHAVPLAVQRHAHRPRRAGAARAGARAPRGRRRLAVRPGRFAYPALGGASASPSRCCATAASCARSPGSARSSEAAGALRRAGQHTGALVGGQATNEEGFLLARLMREGLDSPTSTPAAPARCRWSCTARSPTRACRRRSPTWSSPTPCSCSLPTRSRTCRSSTCACARACAARRHLPSLEAQARWSGRQDLLRRRAPSRSAGAALRGDEHRWRRRRADGGRCVARAGADAQRACDAQAARS